MLRIHFTAEDLARVRIDPTIGPAAETYGALRLLLAGRRSAAFAGWRDSLKGQLGAEVRPLADLVPVSGPMLDMRTLTGAAPTIEQSVENLLRSSPGRLYEEIGQLSLSPARSAQRRRLASGDREEVEQLAGALSAAFAKLVHPHSGAMKSYVDTVRARYARAVLDGGLERLFGDLCVPLVRWDAPVLEVSSARDVDVHLRGRGLVIAPAVLSLPECVLLWDPLDQEAAPTLTIPTVRDLSASLVLWGHQRQGSPPLAALMGRTRATALRIVAGGCTTTQLAAHLGVSPAAASQHATVLRNAHLIMTVRQGTSVLHTATDLGLRLLDSAPAAV